MTSATGWDFRGHPQPALDERLETAKLFLADEDPDRCLEFDVKINQIEELLGEIEKKSLACDALLLKDVKVMVKEHRDWQKGVDDGWTDTKCYQRPPKNPYSTRLIDAATTTTIQDEKLDLGIQDQTRQDAPPFTIERESDHNAFMTAMKMDAVGNPDTIDKDKNLLFIEKRAYDWAIRDPAFIPLWMHPTKGIVKKGLSSVSEKPWYKTPPVSAASIRRPDRGFVPDYLLKREDRINDLLTLRRPEVRDLQELEELLSLHFPDNVRLLYEQYKAFLACKAIKIDPATQKQRPFTQKELDAEKRVKDAYTAAFNSFVASLKTDGVYLIIKKPYDEDESKADPGIFYVDDGVLNAARRQTLNTAQGILNNIKASNRWNDPTLSDGQRKQMAILIRDVVPQNVRDLEQQRDDVLRSRGVDNDQGLNLIAHAKWRQLEAQAAQAREDWFRQTVNDRLQLQFRYLRPGEMKEVNRNIIYIPWSIEDMPDPNPPTFDLKASPEANNMYDKIRQKFAANANPSLDNGEKDFQYMLFQVAYPKLRRYLVPWTHLRDKKEAFQKLNQALPPGDQAYWDEINPVVTKLWGDWLDSFPAEGIKKMKMVTSQMMPESPDVLYWRLDNTATGNLERRALARQQAINRLLRDDPNAYQGGPQEHHRALETALAEVQYPYLKKLWDDEILYREGTHALVASIDPQRRATTAARIKQEWQDLFSRWNSGFSGHKVCVRIPLPYFDPDDDPSVVYYRGPLDEARAENRVRDRMDVSKPAAEAMKQLKQLSIVQGLEDLYPPYIKHLEDCVKENPKEPMEQKVLDWHLEYFKSGPIRGENDSTGAIDTIGIWRSTYVDQTGSLKNGSNSSNSSSGSSSGKSSSSSRTRLNLTTANTRNDTDLSSASSGSSKIDPNWVSATPWSTSGSTSSGVSAKSDGHFTRPPKNPERAPNVDPEIGVDLGLFRQHITRLETEVNELLDWRRDNQRMGRNQFPPSCLAPRTPPQIPSTEDETRTKRLDALLRQFLPDNVRRACDRELEAEQTLSDMLDDGTPDFRERRSEAVVHLEKRKENTASAFRTWYHTLMNTAGPVYIRLSTNPEDERLFGHALVFDTSFTQTGPQFSMLVPENDDWFNCQIIQLGVADVTPPQANPFAQNGVFRTAFLNKLVTEINNLLATRRQNGKRLSTENHEKLLDMLLGFMPRSLFELEARLWDADTKVRIPFVAGAQLDPQQLQDTREYHHLNQKFLTAYDHWLNSFEEEGVFVNTMGNTPPPDPGPVQLTKTPVKIVDPTFWDHWQQQADGRQQIRGIAETDPVTPSTRRAARSRLLPLFVSQVLEVQNTYLRGAAPFAEGDQVDRLLRPVYRPFGQAMRDQIKARLLIPDNSTLTPEQNVIIESTMALAYAVWKREVRRNMIANVNVGVRVVEFGPGRIFTYLGEALPSQANLETPYPQNYLINCEAAARRLVQSTFENPVLKPTGDNFLEIAKKIRTAARVSTDDLDSIRTSLQTVMPVASTWSWQDSIADFIFNGPTLVDLPTTWLRILLWNWSKMHTNLLQVILKQLQVSTIDQLTKAPPMGHLPPDEVDVTKITTPSVSEIQSVEVEINNLLTRQIRTPRQQLELDYLLEALLPRSMRALKKEINELRKFQSEVPGLSPNETHLLFLKCKDWEAQFPLFKQNLPPCGIFLDQYWYSEEAIKEACARARAWQIAEQEDSRPSAYPSTSRTLEDATVKNWHELYEDMKDYASTFDEDLLREECLLFSALPVDFNDIKADWGKFRREALVARHAGDEQKLMEQKWVLEVIGKFIRTWMEWIINLPPFELATLRTQATDRVNDSLRTTTTNANNNNNNINIGGGGGNRIGVPIDYSSKAERRGIQRAAIELALNVLASNQEQHRPLDQYRFLDLPRPYTPLDEGVPLCLPIEPWNRPVELDTFEYTKKITEFHQAKDQEYSLARVKEEDEHPTRVPVPANRNGPFAKADSGDVEDVNRQWLRELATVSLNLQRDNLNAPRPLLQEILSCILRGTANDPDDPLNSKIPLTRDDVNLLSEMSEPSWDEVRKDYPALVPNSVGFAEQSQLYKLSKEFELELDALDWHNRTWLSVTASADRLAQQKYNQNESTTQGYSVSTLVQHINNARIAKNLEAGGTVAPKLCSNDTAMQCLVLLQSLFRIHLNQLENQQQQYDRLVAKIPKNGHPENKYIITKQNPSQFPGIVLNTAKGCYEVQYDATGGKGPPIVQPNKYLHLTRIAYRLGRDTQAALGDRISPERTDLEFLRMQWQGIVNTERRMINDHPNQTALRVEDLALELNKIDPLLARDNNIPITANPPAVGETPAAMLLQMQTLEELSNSWEPRFPEKERLWDFTNDRVTPQLRTISGVEMLAKRRITQYFDVRRFPPGCQDLITRTAIKESGPEVDPPPKDHNANATNDSTDDPEGDVGQQLAPAVKATVAQQQVAALQKQSRHLQGQPPHFPFGENAYQQAYQSFCMEMDLRDVPEFQIPPAPRPGLFGRKPSPEPADPFALPEIPQDWDPDSISIAEKRAQLIAAAKATPGFPDASIPEFYHTPAEIAYMKRRDQFFFQQAKVKTAQDAIVAYYRKQRFEQVSPQEYADACDKLGIDKQTGMFEEARLPPTGGGGILGGFLRGGGSGGAGTGRGGAGGGGGDGNGNNGETRSRTPSPPQSPSPPTTPKPPGWTTLIGNMFKPTPPPPTRQHRRPPEFTPKQRPPPADLSDNDDEKQQRDKEAVRDKAAADKAAGLKAVENAKERRRSPRKKRQRT